MNLNPNFKGKLQIVSRLLRPNLVPEHPVRSLVVFDSPNFLDSGNVLDVRLYEAH